MPAMYIQTRIRNARATKVLQMAVYKILLVIFIITIMYTFVMRII